MKTEIQIPLTQDQIIAIEEKVQAMESQLREFTAMLPPVGSHYGQLYNYLGTLKVNLNSLCRRAKAVSDKISINV